MSYQNPSKQPVPHLANWQIAYVARELRQKKTVTISCLQSETSNVIEQLSSFSNSSPVMRKTISKPNSGEVFLEIVDIY